MQRMLRCIYIFVGIGVLVSCDSHYSVNDYLLHPEKIEKDYQSCVFKKPKTNQRQQCSNLLQAIPIFKHYLSEQIEQPEQFGMNIMKIEYRLVELKKSYRHAKQEHINPIYLQHLEAGIKKAEFELAMRFAVIRFLFKKAATFPRMEIST